MQAHQLAAGPGLARDAERRGPQALAGLVDIERRQAGCRQQRVAVGQLGGSEAAVEQDPPAALAQAAQQQDLGGTRQGLGGIAAMVELDRHPRPSAQTGSQAAGQLQGGRVQAEAGLERLLRQIQAQRQLAVEQRSEALGPSGRQQVLPQAVAVLLDQRQDAELVDARIGRDHQLRADRRERGASREPDGEAVAQRSAPGIGQRLDVHLRQAAEEALELGIAEEVQGGARPALVQPGQDHRGQQDVRADGDPAEHGDALRIPTARQRDGCARTRAHGPVAAQQLLLAVDAAGGQSRAQRRPACAAAPDRAGEELHIARPARGAEAVIQRLDQLAEEGGERRLPGQEVLAVGLVDQLRELAQGRMPRIGEGAFECSLRQGAHAGEDRAGTVIRRHAFTVASLEGTHRRRRQAGIPWLGGRVA